MRWYLCVAATLFLSCAAFPLAGQDRPPVIGVGRIESAPGIDAGVALLFGDSIRSELASVPELRIVERGDDAIPAGARDRSHRDLDYLLRGTITRVDENRYRAGLLLEDLSRGELFHAALLEFHLDAIRPVVRSWRDDLQIALRQGADDRLAAQTALLLEEGNTTLAWDYLLRASRMDVAVSGDTEEQIRTDLARSIAEEVEDVDDLVLLAVYSPDADTLEQPGREFDRRAEEALAHELRDLERSVRRDIRRGELGAAAATLSGDRAAHLRRRHPETLAELERELAAAEMARLVDGARALIRQDRDTESARVLSEAAGSDAAHEELREVLRLSEQRERRSREERIRLGNQPRWDQPRSVRDRIIRVSIDGARTADPEQRFLTGSVATRLGIGFDRAQPILPYLRRYGSIDAAWGVQQGSIAVDDRDLSSRWDRLDLTVATGLAAGTTRIEMVVRLLAGASLMTGYRETLEESGGSVRMTRSTSAGPTAGFVIELGAFAVGSHVRSTLFWEHSWTVWFPDGYRTAANSLGLRVGRVR